MRKMWILAAAVLLSTGWSFAQDQSGQMSANQAGSPTTVQGCLQGKQGTFSLISDSGDVYQLQGGDSGELSKHLRHEVQITGTMAGGPDTTNAASSSPGAAMAQKSTITVQDVKQIAKKCTNKGK